MSAVVQLPSDLQVGKHLLYPLLHIDMNTFSDLKCLGGAWDVGLHGLHVRSRGRTSEFCMGNFFFFSCNT